MILDNFLHYREAQSAAVHLSVAHKGLKDGIPNLHGNTGTVIPDANFQRGSLAGRGYHDPPRIRRDRLASIQDEVGDRSFEAVGIEPAHGHSFMMMLDVDVRELQFH